MSDQDSKRWEAEVRCERCGQNTWGFDHATEMDCIRNLRDILTRREKDLAAAQQSYRRYKGPLGDSLYADAGVQWILSDDGTALLERLGWTPPADWWTYGPLDWLPWRNRTRVGVNELPALVARIQQAREASPADIYVLLVEIERLRKDLASVQTELGEKTQEVDRLQRIASEAWDCFCADGPEQRNKAARHLLIALTAWHEQSQRGGLFPRPQQAKTPHGGHQPED
jgi:hypothetical protein